MTEPTETPPFNGKTWEETVDSILEHRAAIGRANADKQAIREFCQ